VFLCDCDSAEPASRHCYTSSGSFHVFGYRASGFNTPLLDSLGGDIQTALGSSDPNFQGVSVAAINYPIQATTPLPAAAVANIQGTTDIVVGNGPAFASSPAALLAVRDALAKSAGVTPDMVSVQNCTTNSPNVSVVLCLFSINIPSNAPTFVAAPAAVASLLAGNSPSLQAGLASDIASSIGSSNPNLQVASVLDVDHPPGGTAAPAKLTGTVDMNVNDPVAFASSPAAQAAVAQGVAEVAGIAPSLVSVTCATSTPGAVRCSYAIAIPSNPPAGTASPSVVAAALLGSRPSEINVPTLNSLGNDIAAALGSNTPALQGVSVMAINYPSQMSSTTPVPVPAVATILGTTDIAVGNGPAFASSPSALIAVEAGLAKSAGVSSDMVIANCSSNPASSGLVSCSFSIKIPANAPANIAAPTTVASILAGNSPSLLSGFAGDLAATLGFSTLICRWLPCLTSIIRAVGLLPLQFFLARWT